MPQFITAKPVVYLVNLSEKDYTRKKNKWLPKIFEWIQAHGGDQLIPFSGALESKLFDMPDDEKEAYCKEVRCPRVCISPFLARGNGAGKRGGCLEKGCRWRGASTHCPPRALSPSPSHSSETAWLPVGAAQDHRVGLPSGPPHLLLHLRTPGGPVLAAAPRVQGAAGEHVGGLFFASRRRRQGEGVSIQAGAIYVARACRPGA